MPTLEEVAARVNFLLEQGGHDRKCHFGLVDVEAKEREENPTKNTRIQFEADEQLYKDFHKERNRYIKACGDHPLIAYAIMIRLLQQLSSESIKKLAEDEQPVKETLGDA